MAEIRVAPEDIAVISGIGCSSRLPHYMATYGMNTIHGRAAAIATGCKVANPDLTVWQVSGDGDGLAIGGNHFIHANRRNINLNMILLNNRIYGLTKGQYSPTSPRGFVSKSSPYGTVEDPFRPAELCFGARGHLVHDAHCEDNTLQLKLALMGNGEGFPVALGVIRDVDAPTYDEAVHAQLAEVSAQKKYHNFEELLETNDTWTVE